jgi:hypothetical protein
LTVNKTAYTYNISPNGVGIDAGVVHQTSPAWVLTFFQWQIRDTLRTKPSNDSNSTTIADKPLVVENECIEVSVADSKSVLTPSMSATLLVTDVNYETVIAPGDFVFVNMLNWEKDARRVANQARAKQPINGIDDGFKGFFKVQSVRKSLAVDPISGVKRYAIKITGFAFTEFNNCIYFNPYLLNATDQNIRLYLTNIGLDWANMQVDKGLTRCQSIVQYLINSFIGSGFPTNSRKTDPIALVTPNTHFYMPSGVGALLGLSTLQSAKDAYCYLFGIQQYAPQAVTVAQGMNPTGVASSALTSSRFMLLKNPIEGNTVTKPEYWNQQQAWSILNQFTNAPLNEMYTCFKIAPDGTVLPTVVLRQIPFTNDNFQSTGYNVTRFMSLPRWNIDPALAFNFDLGKDETLRTNFVQYFGRSVNGPAGFDISEDIAKQNYVYDIDDVVRNGLRPHVVTSEFDRLPDPPYTQSGFRSPGWAKILGDALIGSHLKMSGTITFVGIPEPIPVGDNLQFDNTVYHIEQITHACSVTTNGDKVVKSFRTIVVVSNGLNIETGQNVLYSEMTYGSGYDKRQDDYDTTQILPGVSESQDTIRRVNAATNINNPDTPLSGGESFTEPNTNTSINKTRRDS